MSMGQVLRELLSILVIAAVICLFAYGLGVGNSTARVVGHALGCGIETVGGWLRQASRPTPPPPPPPAPEEKDAIDEAFEK